MRLLMILFASGISLNMGYAQITSDTAVEVVQKQLEAYNAKNLEAFVAVFHPEAALYNLGSDKPIAKGKAELMEVYGRLFEQSPNLRSDVVSRTVIGSKVMDYEVITGRNNQSEPMYLVAIYEVEAGLIRRCYFVRK
ncbi:MAG: nuclear transport factor 2 family protein [Cryomorphaceae bacterium]|nr:nuclear transport factor 2 family protein [Cryomorphaceae bacterium]